MSSISGLRQPSPTGAYSLHCLSAASKPLSIIDFSKAYKFIALKWSLDRKGSPPSNKGKAHGGSDRSPKDVMTTADDCSVYSRPAGYERKSMAADSPKRPTTPTASPTSVCCRPMSLRATSIVYSQTAAKKTPQPIEKKLECTLEELLHGCVKKVVVVRDVLSEAGTIREEEEELKINVEPGWRQGTRIMFEGKGDERPGYLPANIVFVVEEKPHPLFKRRGRDDLEIVAEVPLVRALTGCTLQVPLLCGETMALSIEEIIRPGSEKGIRGLGMPSAKDPAARGELRIAFSIGFPQGLSEERRVELVSILSGCDYA
ncbi:hypothetical protein SAY87_024570 [Trapa incisa]|uniref:Chaperone DnaJ C-terminal domain-containing protein n=1 Tax=Trapa incisa TaxID=236973 RepID=A0AAN7GQI7_9MYRT|nr:hypothetical protein SAY87_024570 [Trapa incisa]